MRSKLVSPLANPLINDEDVDRPSVIRTVGNPSLHSIPALPSPSNPLFSPSMTSSKEGFNPRGVAQKDRDTVFDDFFHRQQKRFLHGCKDDTYGSFSFIESFLNHLDTTEKSNRSKEERLSIQSFLMRFNRNHVFNAIHEHLDEHIQKLDADMQMLEEGMKRQSDM